ncbi:MAG TPA: response regulator [Kofleriaceae bacterium]|jgi:DNA-binding NtrC family response regulator|nr:response regulator [Kofleriaceae bacterium]
MHRARILIVDDEPQLLRALRSVFGRDRRWDLVFAEGGRDALAELHRGEFDVVVSDMRMPDVDGVALLEAVRQDSPQTVRLMMSGAVDFDETDLASGLAHELVGKPFSPARLRETIERWLGRNLVAN